MTGGPENGARFAHVSMVARDADGLAAFYSRVFGCTPLRAPLTLAGEKVARGNGLPGSEIRSIWLSLPGVEGPFLEIHQYTERRDRPPPAVNEPGYGHLCFAVGNIEAAHAAILKAGGQAVGEVTDFGTADAPVLLVYMRDPEGNIVELEQRGS